jgi:DUF177 domain-containing protein
LNIRLDSARFEPFRWQETVQVDRDELDRPELLAISPLELTGTLSYVAPNYLFEGRLEARGTVCCDRCLTPVEIGLEGGIDLLVRAARGAGGERGEHGLEADELGQLEVAGETLDTRPLAIEQLQLELPVKPLCRDDCAGLCPVCGADRNREQCDCAEETDPRWAALGALKGKIDRAP